MLIRHEIIKMINEINKYNKKNVCIPSFETAFSSSYKLIFMASAAFARSTPITDTPPKTAIIAIRPFQLRILIEKEA